MKNHYLNKINHFKFFKMNRFISLFVLGVVLISASSCIVKKGPILNTTEQPKQFLVEFYGQPSSIVYKSNKHIWVYDSTDQHEKLKFVFDENDRIIRIRENLKAKNILLYNSFWVGIVIYIREDIRSGPFGF